MTRPKTGFQEALSPAVLSSIFGRELLVQHLGYWPTFHDFEVLSLTLERTVVEATAQDLRATFLVFDAERSPDDPERRQGTVEFLFEGLAALRIEGFNHQNPILGLSIVFEGPSAGPQRFRVQWGGTSMQHDVSFTCGRIAVLRVVDLNPFRKARPSL